MANRNVRVVTNTLCEDCGMSPAIWRVDTFLGSTFYCGDCVPRSIKNDETKATED